MAADPDKPTLSERLTRAFIKADTRADERAEEAPQTLEELEAVAAGLDDRERLIGLAAAPLAGVVAIIVVGSYGSKGSAHASTVDSSLFLVLFGLAILALVLAWFRKRLLLGIDLALYGLSVFNLHYWGLGVPFLLIGSWYLVRAYRIQQKLKLARAGGTPAGGSGSARRAQPNKRYTPPTAPPSKAPKSTRPPASDGEG